MATSLSTPLLLVLVGIAGILVGLLLSTLFRGDSKPNPEENPIPKKYVDDGYAEAARLYYSPAAKKSITQLDGDFYSDFAALTPEQKKRVLRIQQTWQEWSEQSASQQKAERTVIPPQLPDAPARAVVTEMNAIPSSEGLTKLTPAAIDEAIVAAKSLRQLPIIDQINEVLKDILANSPEKQRGISLVDNGHAGVQVWIGAERFNGIDVIPYPEVKKLIQAAVTRWEEETEAEKKSSSGTVQK
jgi:hypothetical protein